MTPQRPHRIEWFVSVFLIYFNGGIAAIYIKAGTLTLVDGIFSLAVALVAGVGCSIFGPRFVALVKQNRWQRRS